VYGIFTGSDYDLTLCIEENPAFDDTLYFGFKSFENKTFYNQSLALYNLGLAIN
jgi:hypothetical protein